MVREIIYLEQVASKERRIIEKYWQMHGCVFENRVVDLREKFDLSLSEIGSLRRKSRLQINYGECMKKCGNNVSNTYTSQSNFHNLGKNQWDFIFCEICQSNGLRPPKKKSLVELQNYRIRIAAKGRLWERISKEEYELFNMMRIKGVTIFDTEIPIYRKNNFQNLNRTIERFESLGLIETYRRESNYGVATLKVPDLIIAELFQQEKDKMKIN